MRYLVAPDKSKRIIDLRGSTGKAAIIRPITGGTTFYLVFGEQNYRDLESNRDAAGNIKAGMPVTSVDAPLILSPFEDTVWCLASVQGEIEASDFDRGAPAGTAKKMPQPHVPTHVQKGCA